MAARKQTAVNPVAGLEQQLAALKAQLVKARAAQAADAQKSIAGLVKDAAKAAANLKAAQAKHKAASKKKTPGSAKTTAAAKAAGVKKTVLLAGVGIAVLVVAIIVIRKMKK